MKLYDQFRNSSLDTTPLGLTVGAEHSDSVYTPSGAKLLAWLNDDSHIHFCQINSLGDMVFVVNPKATPGDAIHPVAQNLGEFIGLLIACKDAALIAHAYSFSYLRFQELIAGVSLSMKAKSVLRALENTYHPTLPPNPYEAIYNLQQSFDYHSIPLHPNYFEWCPIPPGTPKWEVGFGVGFSDYCKKGTAGKELAIKRQFLWQADNWTVPGIYLCENGIVVDYYLEVEADRIKAFMEKWAGRNEVFMPVEDQMYQQLENPLDLACSGTLRVNERDFRCKQAFTTVWNPWTENNWKTRRTLEHYGLDRNKGYLLRRECYLRKGKLPAIRTMQLTLSSAPVSVPGQRFIAPAPGEHFTFLHPDTGKKHSFTVISQTREALNPNFLSNHPCCYTKLVYKLDPPIEKPWFQVADCDPGDPWDGTPSDIEALLGSDGKPSGNVALSSVRYTPANQIRWRMIFRQTLQPDVTVSLLP